MNRLHIVVTEMEEGGSEVMERVVVVEFSVIRLLYKISMVTVMQTMIMLILNAGER